MAYKKNYLDEEQGQGQAGAGSGGILAGNSGSGPTPTQQGGGSGWTNLSTYLDMNQGQTEGLANTYAGANQGVIDKAIGSDLVKNTQADAKWSAPINQAKDMTTQVKSGDLSKVDPNQFKTIQGSQYQKPQHNELGGYQDVLSNFGKAADRVDNIDDYGTQTSVLRGEFAKNYKGYNSGMGTLDTFLLRGDKDAAAKTAAFKEKNKDFGSLKNPDGTRAAGVSNRFNSDVTGVLNNFFTGQEGAFNTAKNDMVGAVGQRRGSIESSASPEALAAKSAQMEAEAAKAAGVSLADFSKFKKSQGTLDAADMLSDADWNALATLEGLDGGRSALQNQTRGDYSVGYDGDAAAADKKAKETAALERTKESYKKMDEELAARNAPAAPKKKTTEDLAYDVLETVADPTSIVTRGMETDLPPILDPLRPGRMAVKATKDSVKIAKNIKKKLKW